MNSVTDCNSAASQPTTPTYTTAGVTTYSKGSYYFAWPSPTRCLLCPEGFECRETFAPPRKCLPGYYSGLGWKTCVLCEPGWMCPSEYATYRITCKDAYQTTPYPTTPATALVYTYSLGGATNCYVVPAKMGYATADTTASVT